MAILCCSFLFVCLFVL
ncbi:rCG24719 [Rattus norvegicus]|uniref:RCG24719 n=1 Tax=Rattus norvegicus TaxID=10116 RepID=A6JCE6_RAT|nr:rCG24719 [Rattus norvegicus]